MAFAFRAPAVIWCLLSLIRILQCQDEIVEENEKLLEEKALNLVFKHYEFTCDPQGYAYETSFNFLKGLGTGFVHAEPYRIYFEYYFPAEHWVGFAAADQSIAGEVDHCTQCYFNNYYPSSTALGNCTEECLDDTIFVATVNSDEENLNHWNIIEFQIAAQHSRKLARTMYRIPPLDELLDIWGSSMFPYRENSHFESELDTLADGTEYVHGMFWRRYDFAPDESIDEYDESNEWKPFALTLEGAATNLVNNDALCFISIGSFYGGEYPYDVDAVDNELPGFYIDADELSRMHCFKPDDIKVDCGQDWSFLHATSDDDTNCDGEEVVEEVYDYLDYDSVFAGIDTTSTITTTPTATEKQQEIPSATAKANREQTMSTTASSSTSTSSTSTSRSADMGTGQSTTSVGQNKARRRRRKEKHENQMSGNKEIG